VTGDRDLPSVLFVCVHNAGRSQMAEAFLEAAAAGKLVGESAGTDPGESVHPEVVQVMEELGIDLTGRRPKRLEDSIVLRADLVVTMGCGDACPIFPGKRYEDWDLPDPSGKPLEEVRRVRDEIKRRVERLIQELLGGER
jgi:arsenate reductase